MKANEIAFFEATKDFKIDEEKAALMNAKYGATNFTLNGDFTMFGKGLTAGATVNGATLANMGQDIGDLIKNGLVTPSK
jgi:hypothetical protein